MSVAVSGHRSVRLRVVNRVRLNDAHQSCLRGAVTLVAARRGWSRIRQNKQTQLTTKTQHGFKSCQSVADITDRLTNAYTDWEQQGEILEAFDAETGAF